MHLTGQLQRESGMVIKEVTVVVSIDNRVGRLAPVIAFPIGIVHIIEPRKAG